MFGSQGLSPLNYHPEQLQLKQGRKGYLHSNRHFYRQYFYKRLKSAVMKKATLAKATNFIEGPSLKARHQDWTRQSINLLKD
jgi:hypothetical protein